MKISGMKNLTALLALGSLLLAGCADPPHVDDEEAVQINSTPAGAQISLDNSPLSTKTPMEMSLPKLVDSHLVISKPGFTPVDVYVHNVGGSLTPNPVEVVLRTELLPDKPGPDKAAELAACLENLQKYVAAGTISAEDAPLAEKQIRDFYK